MKFIAIAALSLLSLNTFAADLNSTIKDIEIEKNAKCTKIKTGSSISFGGEWYYYTVKYSCVSNKDDFALKIRMRNNVVRKVVYVK